MTYEQKSYTPYNDAYRFNSMFSNLLLLNIKSHKSYTFWSPGKKKCIASQKQLVAKGASYSKAQNVLV